MIGIGLWPLLLPVAAMSGWFIGRRSEPVRDAQSHLSREYYLGLNYLLNEQPDKAVDVFIKLLEVDGDTVETHLALGSLFRRRGEVDRAIRIHQNLIARPQLTNEQRAESLLALGQDYLSAGVYDRAERIFREFLNIDSEHTPTSLRSLLHIYEREKNWEKAVLCARKIESLTKESMGKSISQHYCELAQIRLSQNQNDECRRYIKLALSENRDSVRATLLQAHLEEKQGRYKNAIKLYKRIKEQDPEFISEIIGPITNSYEALGHVRDLIDFLKQTQDQHPRIITALTLAKFIAQYQGLEAGMDYATAQLKHHPSIRGLHQLIDWHLISAEGKTREKLHVLQEVTDRLVADKPVYRCNHCGFSSKQLHWKCPGCHQWERIKPIHGLEGD